MDASRIHRTDYRTDMSITLQDPQDTLRSFPFIIQCHSAKFSRAYVLTAFPSPAQPENCHQIQDVRQPVFDR